VRLRVGAPNAIPPAADLIITSGTFDLNGIDTSVGFLAADGGFIEMGTANLLVTISMTQIARLKAGIGGGGTLTKAGDGVLILADTPDTVFFGPTVVSAGQFLLA